MYGSDTERIFQSFEAKLDMAITESLDVLSGAELDVTDASNRNRLGVGHESSRLSWGVFIGANKMRSRRPEQWALRLYYAEPWSPSDPQVLYANLVNRTSGENRSVKAPDFLEAKIASESFAKFIISTVQSVLSN
ncbi:hypothetical protein ACSVIJ_18085 [Pseudomonas sp. NCHU5208]|uniref:hypothetical protein n=1 Tax=unclassified Pseudomonas TaxID=196821 RepID=UPI003F965144